MNARENKALVSEDTGQLVTTGGARGVALQPINPAAAKEAVIREVSLWQGVSVHEHRFGGVEFRIGRRELGHLHPRFADLPFPRRIRDELVATGRAKPHHVLPDSGWVTVPMRNAAEVAGVIELFRKNYDRAASTSR